MAKLLGDEIVHVAFPITKFEEDSDGNLVVTGTVTDGSIDSDRQVVDPAWSAKALGDWMASGPNLRVMHSPSLYPAGRGLQIELGDDAHTLKALVVEDTAKKLVRNKVLRAYSVGIANPVIKRDPTGMASGGIITGGVLAEVSLVDRPANKNCQLVLAKAEGNDVPWTYGDLDALLAAAEAVEVTKGKKPKPGKVSAGDSNGDPSVVDPSDPGETDDDSSPDSDADVDDDHGTDDADDADDGGKSKAYQAAVMLHKAAEPRRDGVPLTGTEYLAKAAAWSRWSQHGDDEHLDGTYAGFTAWAAKRDMDPDVGGGVDRDKIPDADHVDPQGRRFPIVSAGDVSDAVSSYGRANPKIPMAAFKDRLTSIAHRKGPAFVAALPESWTAANKDITLTSPDPSGLVPYNLQGQGAEKGSLPRGKQCPNCDMFNKATAGKCKSCGKKFPPMATKGAKDCPGCGKSYDADAKLRRCEGCGKKLPKGDMAKVDKGRRVMPSGVDPAGRHREPDGDDVELFEHDAGMHTDPDEVPDRVPASVKSDESAYVLKRTHDALCAAYDWDTVVDEYPALKSVGEVCDNDWWADQIPAALAKGDMAGVAFLANAATVADALGSTDPAILADVRATVHKSFADMYPTATLHPGTVTPGQYTRPYLSAGRAAPNATGGVTPNIPAPVHTINPDQFDRDLITAGHEAGSPGSQPANARLDTVRTGSARSLYTTASKAAAQTAMQAMHDHIAVTLPDMCPMAPSRPVMPAGMQDTATPQPYRPLNVPAAPGEKTTTSSLYKAVKVATKAARRAEKAAARAAATGVDTVADYETTIADLRAQIDELGSQPDPAQAPLRGVIGKAATSGGTPVEKRSMLAEAQDAAAAAEQTEYVQYLGMMAKSADPGTRERASELLETLLTKSV